MATVAVYAGSFDPFTKGHASILWAALKSFDRVIVAVGHNSSKKTLFSVSERMGIIQEYIDSPLISLPARTKASVDSFEGLLVDFCLTVRDTVKPRPTALSIVRGLRAVSDFETEMAIADANRRLLDIPTLFIPTEPSMAFISSSIVKEIAKLAGKRPLAKINQLLDVAPGREPGSRELEPYVIPSVGERLMKLFADAT